MGNSAALRRYRAAGFDLDSEIAFPQLATEPNVDETPADVTFLLGDLPTDGSGLTARRRTFGCCALDGARVVVAASPCADWEAIGVGVATTGLNAIAYQRGLLPFHASAVQVGDGCIAFCGESGAGKSTLAWASARAGHALASDDLVVVHPGPDAGGLVWPALIRPRLTVQSVRMLGGGVDTLTPVTRWDGKAVTSALNVASYAPRPLVAIYLLAWGKWESRRLSQLEAAAVLNLCLRRPEWLERSDRGSTIRRRWLELVARIPVILATRPMDPNVLSAMPRMLADCWRSGRSADGEPIVSHLSPLEELPCRP